MNCTVQCAKLPKLVLNRIRIRLVACRCKQIINRDARGYVLSLLMKNTTRCFLELDFKTLWLFMWDGLSSTLLLRVMLLDKLSLGISCWSHSWLHDCSAQERGMSGEVLIWICVLAEYADCSCVTTWHASIHRLFHTFKVGEPLSL